MRVMLKASYQRAEQYSEGDGKPVLLSAEYGEVPDELVLGEVASAAMDHAQLSGDERGAQHIKNIIDAARADGALLLREDMQQ